MQLRIRRVGGIAGVRLHTQLDTGELPSEEAGRVEGAVRNLSGHAPEGPPHPDGFRYEITPVDEPDLAPILLDEHDVPPELSGLVESVAESGEIEGGRKAEKRSDAPPDPQ